MAENEFPKITSNLNAGNDDLFTAMKMFQDSVHGYAVSKAFNDAQSAFQDVSSRQLASAEQENQQKAVANQLVSRLGALQVPAAQIDQAAKQFNPVEEPIIQNEAQLATYGSPEDVKAYLDIVKKKNDIQYPGGAASAASPDAEFSHDMKISNLADKYRTSIDYAKQRSGVAAQNLQNLQKGTNLKALLADNPNPANWNQENRAKLTEAVTTTATMLKNGTVTEAEIKALFPDTAKLDFEHVLTYLTGKPQPANAGKFIEFFNSVANRETSLNAVRLRDELLSSAPAGKMLNKYDPNTYRALTAEKLNAYTGSDYKPEDIIIKPNGVVTTSDKELEDKKIGNLSAAAREAKLALGSADPKKVADAKRFFLGFNLEPSLSIQGMQNEIKLRTQLGTWGKK